MQLQADTIGSRYDTVLTVLRGPIGDLRVVACNDDRLGLDSAVRFGARAGVRYIFMVSRCCGTGAGHGGRLQFWLGEAPIDPFAIEVDVTGGGRRSGLGGDRDRGDTRLHPSLCSETCGAPSVRGGARSSSRGGTSPSRSPAPIRRYGARAFSWMATSPSERVMPDSGSSSSRRMDSATCSWTRRSSKPSR